MPLFMHQLRKRISMVLVSLIVLTPVSAEETPAAEPDAGTAQNGETAEAETEAVTETETYAVDIASDRAVLVDVQSGTVLFDKHSTEQADPASLAKIMAVYLSCETLDANSMLTMSDTAFQSYSHEAGVLWIQQGEVLRAEDCEYAAMLASANDTCAMLAEGTAVSIPSFVERMNQTAGQIGMENTSFDNPFGLASEAQYSTAADIAQLVRKAIRNEQFRKIFGTPAYAMAATNMHAQQRQIVNDCALLRQGDYYLESVKGGKIGSTRSGGFSLAVYAEQDGNSLAAVVMQEETADAAYRDIRALLEYGFASTLNLTITPEDIGTETVSVNDGKKHIADVVFSVDSGFNILMKNRADDAELSSEIVVYNRESADPERITAEVVFYLDKEAVGSAPMEREIIWEPEKEPAEKMETVQLIFDWGSVAVLAVILFFPLYGYLRRLMMPPK